MTAPLETKCEERVFDGTRMGIGGHRCSRNAKVVEGGKSLCNLHSAAGQVEKERKFQERHVAWCNERNEHFAKEAYNQAAGNWCRAKGMTLEELA